MDYRALLGLCFVGFATLAFGGGPVLKGPVVPKNEAAVTQEKDSQEASSPAGIVVWSFKPTDFPFIPIVPDTGEGPSGGWQEAKVRLEFTQFVIPTKVIKWWCPITIQIPIRHHTRGVISPVTAATISATVANSVNSAMDYKLPQGIFCRTFVTNVQLAFPVMYPLLGQRVTL